MDRLYRKAQRYVDKFRYRLDQRADPDGFPAYLVEWALIRGKDPTEPINLDWRWVDYAGTIRGRMRGATCRRGVATSLEDLPSALHPQIAPPDSSLLLTQLEKAVELSEVQSFVYHRFLDGCSWVEISELLGVTQGRVHQIYQGILALFRGEARPRKRRSAVGKRLFPVTRMDHTGSLVTTWRMVEVCA